MSASTLKIVADHAKKTLAFDGKIAAREDVDVSLFLGEEVGDINQLRLRVRYEDRDVAMFPMVEGDEWNYDDTSTDQKYTCSLNLNTEQMVHVFNGCDKAYERFVILVDYVSDGDDVDEINVLFGKGTLTIYNWNADITTTEVDEAPKPIHLFSALEKKIDKVADAVEGNIPAFVEGGGVTDSGIAVSTDAIDDDSTDETVPTSAAVYTYVNGELAHKQDELVFDTTPASGSLNPVTSAGIYTALQGKVDKVNGKGLSTNDFSDAEKNKLAGIAGGAEVNVQADWDEDDSTSDAFIKNKPNIPGELPVDTELDGSSANPIANSAVSVQFSVVEISKAAKNKFEVVELLGDNATQKQIREKLNILIGKWNGVGQ